MTYLHTLQVGFRFQYQIINLVWLSFDFFSFSWSLPICFLLDLYSCVCSCSKISRNVFYLSLFIFLVLILKSTCFIFTIWKRKQTILLPDGNVTMSNFWRHYKWGKTATHIQRRPQSTVTSWQWQPTIFEQKTFATQNSTLWIKLYIKIKFWHTRRLLRLNPRARG